MAMVPDLLALVDDLVRARDALAALLAGDAMPGNLTRHVTRARTALGRALKLLVAGG